MHASAQIPLNPQQALKAAVEKLAIQVLRYTLVILFNKDQHQNDLWDTYSTYKEYDRYLGMGAPYRAVLVKLKEDLDCIKEPRDFQEAELLSLLNYVEALSILLQEPSQANFDKFIREVTPNSIPDKKEAEYLKSINKTIPTMLKVWRQVAKLRLIEFSMNGAIKEEYQQALKLPAPESKAESYEDLDKELRQLAILFKANENLKSLTNLDNFLNAMAERPKSKHREETMKALLSLLAQAPTPEHEQHYDRVVSSGTHSDFEFYMDCLLSFSEGGDFLNALIALRKQAAKSASQKLAGSNFPEEALIQRYQQDFLGGVLANVKPIVVIPYVKAEAPKLPPKKEEPASSAPVEKPINLLPPITNTGPTPPTPEELQALINQQVRADFILILTQQRAQVAQLNTALAAEGDPLRKEELEAALKSRREWTQAIETLETKALTELGSGALNLAAAASIKDSLMKLSEKILANKLTQADIDCFANETEAYKIDWDWRVVLGLVIGAAIGLLAGVVTFGLGLAVGAVVATTVASVLTGSFVGYNLGLWQTQAQDPVHQVASSAEEILNLAPTI